MIHINWPALGLVLAGSYGAGRLAYDAFMAVEKRLCGRVPAGQPMLIRAEILAARVERAHIIRERRLERPEQSATIREIDRRIKELRTRELELSRVAG